MPSFIQISNNSRPLVNMSYVLSSDAGKLWAAEQLDSIARRHIPKSAHRIASRIRENLTSSGDSVKVRGPMVPPLAMPMLPRTTTSEPQTLVGGSFTTGSPIPTGGGAQYMYTGSSTSTMEIQSRERVREHDLYQQGPHGWSEMYGDLI